MAVKYVKDFAFDSGFGFSGSSGKTPVKSHMRSPMKKADGGAVKSKGFDNSTRNPISKFPDIAPAMVEKRSKGLGGLASETKKLAAYDKPHAEGKKGAKVAQYAKGGAVKKAHAKKPMPPFLKAKMMKKAEGGPVAEITEGDGMSPLQEMAYALPTELMGRVSEEYDRPQLPPELLNQVYDGLPQRYESAPREDIGQPIGALTPLPEVSYDLEAGMRKGLASGLPPRMSPIEPSGGMTAKIHSPLVPHSKRLPAPIEPDGSGGYGGGSVSGLDGLFGNVPVKRPGGPIPGSGQFGPLAGDDGMMYAGGGDSIRGSSHYRLNPSAEIDYENMRFSHMPLPSSPGLGVMEPIGSPLAVAAKTAARDMRQDRITQARDIMDRYIGGERNAMPRRSMAPGMRGMAESKARRAMPVAPREPMIQLPRAPRGGVATFAKGGKVSKGEKKIGKVMGEFKRGELHSGSKKGPVVTNPKQAKAIALSEARAAGAKVPKKRAMGGRACG